MTNHVFLIPPNIRSSQSTRVGILRPPSYLKGRRYNFSRNAGNEFSAILARHPRVLSFCERTVDYCQIIREQKQSSAGATRWDVPFLRYFSFLSLFSIRRDAILRDQEETPLPVVKRFCDTLLPIFLQLRRDCADECRSVYLLTHLRNDY